MNGKTFADLTQRLKASQAIAPEYIGILKAIAQNETAVLKDLTPPAVLAMMCSAFVLGRAVEQQERRCFDGRQ